MLVRMTTLTMYIEKEVRYSDLHILFPDVTLPQELTKLNDF